VLPELEAEDEAEVLSAQPDGPDNRRLISSGKFRHERRIQESRLHVK
jgi:hypothetical protein